MPLRAGMREVRLVGPGKSHSKLVRSLRRSTSHAGEAGGDQLLAALSNGLTTGLILASIAAGFVLVYRASDILNFAQAQYAMLGAFLYVAYAQYFPLAPAILAACATTGAVGVLSYFGIIRPMVGQPMFATVIVTVALGNVITDLSGVVWGPGQRSVPSFFSHLRLEHFLGLSATNVALIGSGLILAFYALLALMLKWSHMGIAMRAAAENPVLASTVGISVTGVYVVAWLTAGIGATLAGVSFSQQNGVSLGLGDLGLLAFPPLILGGLDSLLGAFVGGIIVGVVDAVVITYGSSQAQFAITYALLLIILMVRPTGLFGSREVRRI
jgi:branched-chain amino acid transport system permease protein